MTSEEVWKLYKEHESLFETSKSENPFLEGLILLDKLTVTSNSFEERIKYHIDFSDFYAADLHRMPDIKEKDIIELIKLGFILKQAYHWDTCFVFSI